MHCTMSGAAGVVVRLLARVVLGMLAGATTAFVVALLRPHRRPAPARYVAPVPPGELKV
jgi:hypothetical protein